MSEQTKIQWATHTFNPWIGCTKVSPGCLNCYAEMTTLARVKRANGIELWGKGQSRHRTSEATWRQPVKWNSVAAVCDRRPGAGTAPLQESPRVFPSLCDWLDDEVPIEWLADFLKLIHETPGLDWLLLTKRPENFVPRLHRVFVGSTPMSLFATWLREWFDKMPYEKQCPPHNIWLGVSVEDRARKSRIEELCKIPAHVRFLSLEPLLEDLGTLDLTGIHWVIVGGESGAEARPCNVMWIRSIVRQCAAAGVPCFVKQLGTNIVSSGITIPGQHWPISNVICPRHDIGGAWRHNLKHPKGGAPEEWPEDLRLREFPNLSEATTT